jgi:hypothetical protein
VFYLGVEKQWNCCEQNDYQQSEFEMSHLIKFNC